MWWVERHYKEQLFPLKSGSGERIEALWNWMNAEATLQQLELEAAHRRIVKQRKDESDESDLLLAWAGHVGCVIETVDGSSRMRVERRGGSVQWATWDDRPDIAGIPPSEVWPEYNLHGDVVGALWSRLYDAVPQFQSVCVDEQTGQVLAEANTIPCWWDGTDDGLGPGIDATMADAFARLDTGEPANALCALAGIVAPAARGRGLAGEVLREMRRVAVAHGLGAVIAPVRPSWKARYPLVAIAEYVTWRRADGLSFDPWMRVHERLGARMGPALPRSLRISGSVADWESWTGLPLPVSGRYVFPEGLALLEVDRNVDRGEYWEPNVWYFHPV